MRIVTATAVLRAVHAAVPECPAIVAQTGGGCATIYLGTPAEDAAGDPRYWLAIGPGTFDWSDAGLSTFTLGDDCTCIGPDDDGAAVPTYVDTLAELTAAVRAVRRMPA